MLEEVIDRKCLRDSHRIHKCGRPSLLVGLVVCSSPSWPSSSSRKLKDLESLLWRCLTAYAKSSRTIMSPSSKCQTTGSVSVKLQSMKTKELTLCSLTNQVSFFTRMETASHCLREMVRRTDSWWDMQQIQQLKNHPLVHSTNCCSRFSSSILTTVSLFWPEMSSSNLAQQLRKCTNTHRQAGQGWKT